MAPCSTCHRRAAAASELEGQLRPFRALTLNAAVAYTKAEYTSDLIIPGGPGSQAGDLRDRNETDRNSRNPRGRVNLGARYDFKLGDVGNAYARIDYRWFDGYQTVPPGTAAYSPDSSDIPAQKDINLRIGFEYGRFRHQSVCPERHGRGHGSPHRRALPVHQRRLQHLQ